MIERVTISIKIQRKGKSTTVRKTKKTVQQKIFVGQKIIRQRNQQIKSLWKVWNFLFKTTETYNKQH